MYKEKRFGQKQSELITTSQEREEELRPLEQNKCLKEKNRYFKDPGTIQILKSAWPGNITSNRKIVLYHIRPLRFHYQNWQNLHNLNEIKWLLRNKMVTSSCKVVLRINHQVFQCTIFICTCGNYVIPLCIA